ncbi:MAG: SMI1/KNR4 family protein [Oscillospiraceae bacterium]|nr:SMI1/KNR4 family protein [Oscillospiraceae bacterium]
MDRDPAEWELDELENKYVIFADDPAGNYIAFEKSTDKVVFICLDTCPGGPALDHVADSFEEFIDKCYISEDDEDDLDDEE